MSVTKERQEIWYPTPTNKPLISALAKVMGVSKSKVINSLIKEKTSGMSAEEKERLINLSKSK